MENLLRLRSRDRLNAHKAHLLSVDICQCEVMLWQCKASIEAKFSEDTTGQTQDKSGALAPCAEGSGGQSSLDSTLLFSPPP
ncbi:Uncharacterized protein HZ326_5656 [Fusarium oxysporum f. sp. albedinis]|nr:Uncharacterized protein HZ326_5656 [Fusarium oxysporum f. sp. albedinis]